MKCFFIISMYLCASLALTEWAYGNSLLGQQTLVYDEPGSVGIDETALTNGKNDEKDVRRKNEKDDAWFIWNEFSSKY